MIVTKTRRKIVVTRIRINRLERYKPIDIRLPAHTKKVTGVLVTASLRDDPAPMARLGQISFQSNDQSDVFKILDVIESGEEISDESMLGVENTQFDNPLAWVTGRIPAMIPLNVSGDTTSIRSWFRGEDDFIGSFFMTVYMEYEEVEALIDNQAEALVQEKERSDELKEIIL